MKKVCVLLLFASPFFAQVRTALQGEILAGPGEDASWLTVRLRSAGSGGVFESVPVEAGGSFTIRDVEPGTYTLLVLDPQANEIAWQSVTVTTGVNPPVSIRLADRKIVRPSGETISAARLLHPPDKRALRAAGKAQKFSRSGAYDRAAAELEYAVRLDPMFSEAFNNLGVQYMRLGRPTDAVEAFRRAVAVDPAGPLQQANLAIALTQSGRIEEAEIWARSAVRLDPSNPGTRSILDRILMARRQTPSRVHRDSEAAASGH